MAGRDRTPSSRLARPAANVSDSASEPADGLSADDLRDIQELLTQEQDLTRQDMPARSFEQQLKRFDKKP